MAKKEDKKETEPIPKIDPLDQILIDEEEIDDELEDKSVEEILEKISEPDIKSLTLNGKDAVIDREIEVFDLTDQKKKILPIKVSPITSDDHYKMEKAVQKKDSKFSLNQLYCLKGARDENGFFIPASVVRGWQSGLTKAVAKEVRYVSGEFKDDFEEKMIDKLFGPS